MKSFVFAAAALGAASAADPCAPVSMEYGVVCACNATYCDSFEPVGALDEVVVFQSVMGGQFMQRSELSFSASADADADQHVTVDASTTFQSIIGFGGAFTDAAAINLYSLPEAAQAKLLESYFGDSGAQYTVGRIPIASCDFSTSIYSYDDTDGDLALDDFSIAMDLDQKIPMIQRALAASSREVNLFGSSWAPPAWMCEGNTTVPCKMAGEAGDELHQSYAEYLVRFVDEYAAQGLDMWGMTVANEPANPPATQRWQDLSLSPEQERDFVKLDLGPKLRAAYPDLKLMMHDDQRSNLPTWTETILGDPDAAQYIDGVGFHWYAAVEDKIPMFSKVRDAVEAYPDKFFLATEACEGYLPWSQGPQPGSWERAETYAHDIIGDLGTGAAGWTDWNVLLDQDGLPNHADNPTDAPVLLAGKFDEANDTFYKQPMYYIMSHFSKFLPEGSVRVDAPSAGDSSKLETVAFQTPEGNMVVQVLNRDKSSHAFYVDAGDKGFINAEIPARSMQSFLY